ncbi:hypothetical protein LIER_36604 [Lithospermum erythrorhizon]|uniref:Uncharacterized protein n=1 Tax=Lithospermum erythrorhizon TaxID=34254 RepID=A0AAV3PC77_LITER
MVIQEGLTQEENARLRLEELESLDERRSCVQMGWTYVIQEVYTNGSYLMVDQEGIKVGYINGRYLELYYP